jgi:hypothetical protein
LSKEIIDEYEEVVKRDEIINKIDKHDLKLSKVSQSIINNAIIVVPKVKLNVVKDDPDDDKFVECACEGRVDFIVTGDNHLLKIKDYNGIKIITPKEFLKQLIK